MVLEVESDANRALVTDMGNGLKGHMAIRAGLARGPVIMFEGDDYIGRATNVASRLCDSAMPGEVLEPGMWHRCPRAGFQPAKRCPTRSGFDKPLEPSVWPLALGHDGHRPDLRATAPQVSSLVTRNRVDGPPPPFVPPPAPWVGNRLTSPSRALTLTGVNPAWAPGLRVGRGSHAAGERPAGRGTRPSEVLR